MQTKYNTDVFVRLTLGAMSVAALCTACTHQPEELKTFGGYDVSQEICNTVQVRLPKKSSHGTMNVVHDRPITEADLKPGEVRVVAKRSGKNFDMSGYNGHVLGWSLSIIRKVCRV